MGCARLSPLWQLLMVCVCVCVVPLHLHRCGVRAASEDGVVRVKFAKGVRLLRSQKGFTLEYLLQTFEPEMNIWYVCPKVRIQSLSHFSIQG